MTGIVLWILFFTVMPVYTILLPKIISLNRLFRLSIIAVPVILLLFITFYFGYRLKKKEFYEIIAVFESVIFLLNFIPATFSMVTSKTINYFDPDFANNFIVDVNSPSPNIYWFFMDGMLGFKAMEEIFGDPQLKFELKLTERGFLVNRDAQFEIGHMTMRSIPALMSPHYYDATMMPLLAIADLQNYESLLNSLNGLDTVTARLNNELIFAFNAKGYQTNTIALNFGRYFYPITTHFYFAEQELKSRSPDAFESGLKFMQIEDLFELVSKTAIPSVLINQYIYPILLKSARNQLELTKIPMHSIDRYLIYGNAYPRGAVRDDTWHIDALAEIFSQPEPHITIIHDLKAHVPFILKEDGISYTDRTEKEVNNPYNYPPQHRFTREVIVHIVDLIIENDPGAIIVIQADHGLHNELTRAQMLADGGTADTVRLMQNNTMSAVRIPEKWGGLEAPLDPLNITRVLVNRYVGPNYELLETHP
ncbi:hypothetical protein FACS1894110_22830 [Spirochaetia bacterium]|nr:hypothetical protein FACS1894110_22830 [Spirochaetia bacterium]